MRTSKHLIAAAALTLALTACLATPDPTGSDGTSSAATPAGATASQTHSPAPTDTTSSDGSVITTTSPQPTTTSQTTTDQTATAPATTPAATPAADGPGVQRWAVAAVIDGDTIDVTTPDGTQRVRLIGINTPEDGECWAAQAAAALENLIAGATVGLTRDVSDTDQYGRWLRYVDVDGVDAGAELIAAGHALARRYDPDTARHSLYEQLQTSARDRQLGVWSPDACGGDGAGTQLTIAVRWDADGNDNENLNDEWAAITNTSSTPADLTGWQLADESASHRYTISPAVLQPGETLLVRTGCGASSSHEQHWCADGAVWNNSGDTVFVRNAHGSLIVSHSYSEHDTQPPPR